MYYLDRQREQNGARIYKVRTDFDKPLRKDRNGNFKITSGETLRVCMTSDFFLEEADKWRNEAWEIISRRRDVIFFLLTKRPQRVEKCLPENWGEGWENVFFNVTCENQRRADERIPLLLELPFKHKGIMVAPFIGEVSIEKYLEKAQTSPNNTGQNVIEQVICGGENYDGARPCNFDWVKKLRYECEKYNVKFSFYETCTKFVKDRKLYTIKSKQIQSQQAGKS
jgi:protein gp37